MQSVQKKHQAKTPHQQMSFTTLTKNLYIDKKRKIVYFILTRRYSNARCIKCLVVISNCPILPYEHYITYSSYFCISELLGDSRGIKGAWLLLLSSTLFSFPFYFLLYILNAKFISEMRMFY